MRTNLHRSICLLSAILVAVLLAAACENTSQTSVQVLSSNSPLGSDVSVLPTPTAFVMHGDPEDIEIKPGMVVVTGYVISARTGEPIRNTPVRLAQMYYAEEGNKDPEQSAWALDNAFSPFVYSDSEGFFVFANVPVHDYLLLVGDVIDRFAVETTEDGTPRPRTVIPDQINDFGKIELDY